METVWLLLGAVATALASANFAGGWRVLSRLQERFDNVVERGLGKMDERLGNRPDVLAQKGMQAWRAGGPGRGELTWRWLFSAALLTFGVAMLGRSIRGL